MTGQIRFTPLLIFLLFAPFKLLGQDSIYLEWTEDPLHSMDINWITDVSGSTPTVRYRVRGSSGIYTAKTGTSNAIPHTSKQRNRVHLEGLSPGTSYEFTIDGFGGSDFFRTPPSDLDGPLRFVVGGDVYSEGHENTFEETSIRAATHDPWFAVLGGDLAYADASPAKANRWLDMLETWYIRMVTSDSHLIPLIMVVGNHEVPNGYGDDFDDAIYLHALFNYPGDQWSGEKKSYGVLDFGAYLSIITLDTNHIFPIAGAQTTWLDNVLDARSDILHRFPVYHVAGWNSSDRDPQPEQSAVRDNWSPVFEDHDIRFVFEHHDHAYKRTKMIRNESVDETGVIYLGDGAWGAGLRNVVPGRWYLEVALSKNHYNLVEITDTYRKMTAIDNKGVTIDTFTDIAALSAPQLQAATNITNESFQINWQKVNNADNYRLDISTKSDFSTYVSGFQNLNIGDRTSYTVTLPSNETYFYRLRAEIPTVTSKNSVVQSVKLVKPDPDKSEMNATTNALLADGEASSTITVTIRDSDGDGLDDVSVTLSQDGSSQITTVQGTTDAEGRATFRVRSSRSEHVIYTASAAGTTINKSVTISFTPLPPTVMAATEATETGFRANWGTVVGDVTYFLDISTESDFSSFVSGYEGFNAGSSTSRVIGPLATNETYHYRVRARIPDLNGQSFFSNWSSSASIRLFRIDPDVSQVLSSDEEVRADGDSFGTITVIVRDEFGGSLSGVNVSLSQGNSSSMITTIQGSTDEDGEAIFHVSNTQIEEATYMATARNTLLAQSVTVHFIPVPPVILAATNINATTFRANWQTVSGADSYRLDVSDDETFSTFLSGYQNLNVGNSTFQVINGLTPGTTYYYRVRNITDGTSSHNSVTMNVTTLQADPDVTTLVATPDRLPADGMDESSILVWVRDENGTDLEGIPVTLSQGGAQSEVTTLQGISDVNGEALFSVTNTTAERVTYSAQAGVIEINNSVTVSFTPLPPATLQTDHVGALLFRANWSDVPGATGYELDVSTSSDFSSFVPGYESAEVTEGTSVNVTGLSQGTVYYYRVRTIAETGVSGNSGTISLETRTINRSASAVSSSMSKILANGRQETIVAVNIVDDENNPVEGVPVILESEDENSTVRPVDADSDPEGQSSGGFLVSEEDVTDADGNASFGVSSSSTGSVVYKVIAGGVELERTITIEFLTVTTEPEIGYNYPNPFRDRTTIPLTLPESADVRLYVINMIGQRVLTLIDRQMEAGYFEIPADLSSLAPGNYIYWLIIDNKPVDDKMMSFQ